MNLEFNVEQRKVIGTVLICNISDWKNIFEDMFLVKSMTKNYTWRGKIRKRYGIKALFMEIIDEDAQVFADVDFLETGEIPIDKESVASFIDKTKKVIAYCKIFKERYSITRISKSNYLRAFKK